MLASVIFLVSVAFCAQLHFCAAEEFNELLQGTYYVARTSEQKGRLCSELTVTKETDKKLTIKLTFKKETANGQLEQAEPIVRVLTFDDTTGFYCNEKGIPVVRVAEIETADGVTQAFLESKDNTIAPYVCISTNHDNKSQDLINRKCPQGSDGKPFFPVTQDHDTCDSHSHPEN